MGKVAVVAGLVAAWTPCAASAETLAEALAMAYRSNPVLQSQRYRLQAVDESYVQAHAGLRPTAQVQASGGYSNTHLGKADQDARRGLDPFPPDYQEQNSSAAQLVIDQPIYTGGRTTAEVHAAEAQIRAARAALQATEGNVMLTVVQAYAAVRRDTEALRVRGASLQALARQLAETQARARAGEVTRTDIAQAEAQLAADRALLESAQAQLQASRAAYATVVGQNPGELAPEPPLPGLPASIDQGFDIAESASPELAQARFAEQQSRARVAAARAAGRPTLSVRGALGYSGALTHFDARNEQRSLSAQAVVSQPLFTGGLNGSLIRQALDQNTSDRINIETARRDVVQNVANAWNQMVAARANVVTHEQQVRAAEIAVTGMRLEYRPGLRSTFDVLVAEQTLRDAELALLAARHDAYVGAASLLRYMGRLEARDLVEGLRQYDPAAHLRKIERAGAPPWDGAIAALDALGAPGAGQRPITAPARADRPVIATPHRSPPADAPLATGVRTTPLLGSGARKW